MSQNTQNESFASKFKRGANEGYNSSIKFLKGKPLDAMRDTKRNLEKK